MYLPPLIIICFIFLYIGLIIWSKDDTVLEKLTREALQTRGEILIRERQTQEIPEQPRELVLNFNGSAREYFRIWIVNLCLTILTLGIFSAWAKVRKKRYFYSHTTLDGTPFQYLGQPIPILKGRVIAVIAFLAYYTSTHFFTSAMPYVLATGAVLAPWAIVRTVAFNSRYSAFRNMMFHFDGKYMDALKVIYAWGIIPAIVVGMIFNWWEKYVWAGVIFAVFGLIFPWWIKRLKNFIIGHTSYGDKKGVLSATGGQFFKVYFTAGLIMLAFLIITGCLVGVSKCGMKSEVFYLLWAAPVYIGYVLAFAYVQAQGSNLVWNHTRLGPLRFQSTLLARGLAKLYITNALAIIATLGMLTPWAVMRTLKYRTDNMRVLQEADLTDFRGSSNSDVQAAGSEIGDFFDVDLSL